MESPTPLLLLSDEHRILGRFFEYTPDLLCIANFEGYFLKVNPAVISTLGYTEEELLASKIKNFIVEEDRELTGITREEMLQGKPLLNFENRYVKKCGEIVWLSWTSVSVYDDRYIFAIAKNVTKRKEEERKQQILFEEVSQINRDLEHFARLASHNLRSPLSNIRSLFDLIDYDKINHEDNLHLINLIKLSTDKVSVTLENYINELVKKDTNAKLRIGKLNIDECLAEVCESVNAMILSNGAVLQTDFSAFHEVEFNKSYLDSVLLNLLTNALKYRKPNVNPIISFKTSINGENSKQLSVGDNGQGFDMKKAEGRIFGLNQTFHNNRDSKGVGLFLVKKQVTEMGGDIEVVSEKNIGTTFTITFKS